jgi:hypothetical protein
MGVEGSSLRLRLQISIEAIPGGYNAAYGNLQLSETVNLDAASFLEIASILGRFHELAEKVEEERGR